LGLNLDGFRRRVKSGIIDSLIESYSGSGKGLVLPVFNNRRGHPLLIDNKYRAEITGLNGPEGLKELLNRHPDDIYEVKTYDPTILKDIDTIEDYENELN